ncbi:hypothetical protein [Parabacteroides pacaensis]|uniref:hypothetical protein n=1 Tax=Parabacteroides pacaensis TaxID=2086575 RepID=UPI00131DC489|nr:hypothetical protein [Parabacteroides pacaensis]
MNKKYFLMGAGALFLLLGSGLNIQYALNNYGITKNSLHVEVLAQTNNSGGDGSGSNGGNGSGEGGGNTTTPGGKTSGGGGGTGSYEDYYNQTDKFTSLEVKTEFGKNNVKIEYKRECRVWNTYCQEKKESTCHESLNKMVSSCGDWKQQ